jgi:hypothetical protein
VSAAFDDVRQRVGTCADVLRRHGVEHRLSRSSTPTAPRGTARCPFHPDGHRPRSWSLALHAKDGVSRWKCFGCGEGGDALDLEARLSGARDVVEWLRRV